ncbi:hypothetical protein TELCIR_15649, partial [Teladorsagia circumcincta]
CRRRENVMIVDLLVLTVLLQLTAPVAKAIPRRGNEPWSLILCKFRDSDYEPRTAEWFAEWISGGNNPGEYDDKYDLMSTANAHMRPSTYGLGGPGLNGPHLDYLGWLPQNRIVYFGRDGRSNYTLRLSSLSVPHRLTMGWLLVMIPYDRDDPGNVYTIEYRTPVGNDAAIKQEVCRGTDVQMPVERTSELVLHGLRSVCVERNRTVTQRDVDRQYLRNSFFQMRKTFGQNECKVGRIWRGIDAYDYVCVEPHRADEVVDSVVSIDDVNAGCDVDYVPRNAFHGDKACVSEDERALVHKENAESHLNIRNYAFFNGADSIMLSRVDSVENFTDLTAGVRPSVERVAATLAEFFPLLKDLRMRDDQRDTVAALTNRFLMALDYKLRTSTGEGLREHLRPCKQNKDRLN